MKPDITTRSDIETLMRAFYTKAIPDAIIGHFFTEVMHMDVEKHMVTITNFWESMLLNNPTMYTGNAMAPHITMNQLSPVIKTHLDRWVFLFYETVDEMFEGNTATLAKQRGRSIATIMELKFVHQV